MHLVHELLFLGFELYGKRAKLCGLYLALQTPRKNGLVSKPLFLSREGFPRPPGTVRL